MFKAVIFDMDGVVVDSDRILHDIEQEVFKDFGIKITDEEHLSWVGTTAEKFWAGLKEQCGLKQSVDELIAANREKTLEHFRVCPLEPMEGILEFLDELKDQNIKFALASSASSIRADLILKRLDLADLFSNRVTAQDVVNGKPDPEVFLKAATKLGVDPSEAVVIEDAKYGVQAAKAAGIKCIGFNAVPGRQDLSEADLIVGGFKELNYDKLVDLVSR